MTDNTNASELTKRQEEILGCIVQSYTQRPEPVSSKHLKETYHLSYSSATIRNEMVVLDELGYIASPHTSSGRVPTEKGYRYFVKRLLDDNRLNPNEKTYLAEKFGIVPATMESWLRGAALQLARTAQIASLVTPPIAETSRLKHLELISIQGRLCLMVLVLQGGTVHQQILTLAESVPQPMLSSAAEHISKTCIGSDHREIRLKSLQMGILERDICELACDLMERADQNHARVIYRGGLSEIIGEASDNLVASQTLRIFEENAILNMIVAEMIDPLESPDIQVIIAGEERWEQLSHLSMVISRYGIPGQATGTLGVVGPTHIDYSRAVSAVRYFAELMTTTLQEIYRHPPNTNDTHGSDILP